MMTDMIQMWNQTWANSALFNMNNPTFPVGL